jgi:hypothetical protein
MLSGEESKAAHDLAALQFREHTCEAKTRPSVAKPDEKRNADSVFVERARMLIKRGYTPKVAVDLVFHEMEFEHQNDPRMAEKAQADPEGFLLRVQKGFI